MPITDYLGKHAIIIAGYEQQEANIFYWLAKNSWGLYWGEKDLDGINNSTIVEVAWVQNTQ
ncbi:Cathepsin B precursor [Senna tora]|uniref:Cathepsin B n=1 Tax=Senna tora TaxID=362788 RepID=A0A834SY98_9FABA|nr:Cathepsin B precursor [Senna tora]